jgi:5'-methylthioadenosine phosphorylase
MPAPLKIGLIGGSGLGEALSLRENGTPQYFNTPFGKPSAPIIETVWHGIPVAVLQRHGHGHLFNPSCVPYRANIYALKQLGVTHILASGAVGSLREEYRPRDVVVPDQVIDKTYARDASFFEHTAVHVEFAEPFCPVLRRILKDVSPQAIAARGSAAAMAVHHAGCYVAMEGPAFSTRAESLMHRLWGGDLIGMTAMPEAKLAREAELPYALIALVTDFDSWRQPPAVAAPNAPAGAAATVKPEQAQAVASDKAETRAAATETPPAAAVPPATPEKHALLNEILGNLKTSSENAIALMRAAVERIAADPAALDACPASTALELAIWSDKTKIPHEEIDRLRPIWGAYFPQA